MATRPIVIAALTACLLGLSHATLTSKPQSRDGADYRSCADELDDLYDAADDAKDAAAAAANAADDVEAAQRAVRSNCELMTGMEILCDSARSRLRSRRVDFESAEASYRSEYADLTTEIRSVQTACAAGASLAPIPGVAPQHQEGCRFIRRYPSLPESTKREACAKLGIPTDQCNLCIQAR